MRRNVLWVLLSLVPACKRAPEVDPRFEQAKAAFQKKLQRLPAIASVVDATPTITTDSLKAVPARRFTLISKEQLTQLGNCFDGTAAVCDPLWWVLSQCERTAALSPEAMASTLGQSLEVDALVRCSTLEYLAVVRKHAFIKPSADKASRTYQGGLLSTDVLVFDLNDGALLGGFRAESRTPETLEKVTATTDVNRWLHVILGDGIYRQARARLDP